MQTSPHYIAQQLRSHLPAEKKEASWGYLAEQFPWYPLLHLLRAASHPADTDLVQKAAIYQDNILRLHTWLHADEIQVPVAPEKEMSPAGPVIPTEFAPASGEEDTDLPEPDDAETPGPESAESAETAPEIRMPDLSKILQAPAANPSGLAFEPYHTVDYFASQGIKAAKGTEKQEVSQLDQQVKSFTAWLKSMKKLSYQPATTYTDPLVDAQARSSLHKKEIVTEAMAEVWVKQGQFDMAAQVYAKLMLQHPEKTPYFAARLQELKEKQ